MSKPEIPNIYNPGTQLHTVLEMLKAAPGGLTGRDFLRAYLPEYRTRCNELRKDGYIIKREREAGSKFVRFILVDYAPLFAQIKEAI